MRGNNTAEPVLNYLNDKVGKVVTVEELAKRTEFIG